ncbi:hypothetical protein HDU98_000366 [Podochytrium sp. JEL0797]|nr:hypothetical protein HDU98_000366 [Podochytrium sp. JEL0797]
MILFRPLPTLPCILALLLSSPLVTAFDWVLHGPQNSYTSFTSTLTVPPIPSVAPGTTPTWYYWPGLQTDSRSANYQPIGYGVLQPVLTFGPACHNVGTPPLVTQPYASWYVSAWYVNLSNTTLPGYRGCYSGDAMLVSPNDALVMSMQLSGTTWTQSITRKSDSKSVNYVLDMKGQGQNRAELVLELWNKAVIRDPVTFTDMTLTVANAEPAGNAFFCNTQTPGNMKKNEVCSGVVLSADGKTCTVQQCVFSVPPPAVTGVAPSSSSGSNSTTTPPPPDTNTGSGSIAPPPPPPDAPADTNAPIVNPPPDTNSANSTDPTTNTGGGAGIVWGDQIQTNNTVPDSSTTITPSITNTTDTASPVTSPPAAKTLIPGVPNVILFSACGAVAALVLGVLAFVVVNKRKTSRAAAARSKGGVVEPYGVRPGVSPYPKGPSSSPTYVGGSAARGAGSGGVSGKNKAAAASAWDYESPREARGGSRQAEVAVLERGGSRQADGERGGSRGAGGRVRGDGEGRKEARSPGAGGRREEARVPASAGGRERDGSSRGARSPPGSAGGRHGGVGGGGERSRSQTRNQETSSRNRSASNRRN